MGSVTNSLGSVTNSLGSVTNSLGSVTNSLSGLTYLTQPGGVLSNLPTSVSVLQSASPQDIVSLSLAAIQQQQVDGLLGLSEPTPGTLGLPAALGDTAGNNIAPGVSSADPGTSTSQQQAQSDTRSLLLQQAQALFDPPSATSSFNLAA